MRAPANTPTTSSRQIETMLSPMSFNTWVGNDRWLPPAKLMHAFMGLHSVIYQPNDTTVLTTTCGSCANDGTMVSELFKYHGLETI